MADIDIDVNPQQSPINISPNPQQNIIPVEVEEGTAPTYWGQILGDIDNQTDLKEKLDSKQDTIVDLDKYLKNNTTQDNGLAIKGTVSDPAGTAVGDNASATRAGVSIGRKAESLNYGVAIGGTDGNTITHASATAVAIGYGAVCNGSSAAQIGMGQNDTVGTFQFKDYRLLNADGSIPSDRIPQLSSKANTDLDNLTATGEAKFDAKVDLDGNNATFAHIVETYHNGTDWYRVWSDGWCEQGGVLPVQTSTVNFLKAFTNTDYTVFVSPRFDTSNDNMTWRQFGVNTQTTTNFTIYATNTSLRVWRAEGYIS